MDGPSSSQLAGGVHAPSTSRSCWNGVVHVSGTVRLARTARTWPAARDWPDARSGGGSASDLLWVPPAGFEPAPLPPENMSGVFP